MENNLEIQINEAGKRLRLLIQQKEQVEGVLLQYQNGIINSHKLFESYHNLTKFIEEFSGFMKKFREDLESPRGVGANRDAQYYKARRLHEQILAQVAKVQDLSNRVKTELNTSVQTSQKGGWEKFSSGSPEALVDINEGKASLQLQADNEQNDVQAYQDMQRIETDILKINEMFTSLAGFVHEQGELTDRIEANVEVAYSQVDSGNTQLSKAVGHKRSATRKKVIIGIIALVVVLFVVLILYLTLKN